jgi:hypothetical protein
VVDWTVLARGIADIRDAVERFRAVLPASASAFESDRGDLLEYCDRLARRA